MGNSYNVRTLRSSSTNIAYLKRIRYKMLLEELQQKGVDVIGIQETRIDDTSRGSELGYTGLFSGSLKGQGGVGLLYKINSFISIKVIHSAERILIVDAECGNKSLTFMVVYSPTDLKQNKDGKRELLREIVIRVKEARGRGSDLVVVLGDFNCSIGRSKQEYREHIGAYGFEAEDKSRSGEDLIHMAEEADLRFQNTFFEQGHDS